MRYNRLDATGKPKVGNFQRALLFLGDALNQPSTTTQPDNNDSDHIPQLKRPSMFHPCRIVYLA